MAPAIKVNNYREGLTPLRPSDRIRFCFDGDRDTSRYIEVYFDDRGELWVSADEGLVIQAHSSNRAVIMPARIGGRSVTERLAYPPPGRRHVDDEDEI